MMYSYMTFLKNSRNVTNKYFQVCSYSEAKDYHVRSMMKLYFFMVYFVRGLKQICYTNNPMYKNHLWLGSSYNVSLSFQRKHTSMKIKCSQQGSYVVLKYSGGGCHMTTTISERREKNSCAKENFTISTIQTICISVHIFPTERLIYFQNSRSLKSVYMNYVTSSFL